LQLITDYCVQLKLILPSAHKRLQPALNACHKYIYLNIMIVRMDIGDIGELFTVQGLELVLNVRDLNLKYKNVRN
jgi:hypothetical protein